MYREGSALGPVVFNILFSDRNGGAGCSLSRSAGDTKVAGVAVPPTGSCCHPEGDLERHTGEGAVKGHESLRELGLHPGEERAHWGVLPMFT